MAQHFRTATPPGDWRSISDMTCDLSAGYTSGEILKVQDTFGIVHEDAAYGEEFEFVYHIEKVIVDKLTGSGEAIVKGQRVYHSGVYGTGVTAVWQSGFYWIGIATENAGANVATVEIDLKGDKATLGA